MTYRIPVIGDRWHARHLPAHITVEVLDLEDNPDNENDPIVKVRARTTVKRAVHESVRTMKLSGFHQHYVFAGALPNGAAHDEVVTGPGPAGHDLGNEGSP